MSAPAMRVVVIDAETVAELERRAVDGFPREACGLLVGRRGGRIDVARATASANLATDRPEERYELDPRAYLEADRQARRDGLEIVGVWHTHPNHPAEPSRTDLDEAWKGWIYLILAVDEDGPGELRCWRLVDERFTESRIEIDTRRRSPVRAWERNERPPVARATRST